MLLQLPRLAAGTRSCRSEIPLRVFITLRTRRSARAAMALPKAPASNGYSSKSAMEPAVASSCPLLELSHDMLGVVAHELCDPLRPLLVVNLSSAAKRAPGADAGGTCRAPTAAPRGRDVLVDNCR